MDEILITWLLEGDPAIRWRTMRDLLGTPAGSWQRERRRTLAEGWGAQLLAHQAPEGSWGGGIYTPKWTSTTYTLLDLCEIGIPPSHGPAQRAAELVLDRQLGRRRDAAFMRRLAACDRCIVGLDLRIAAYFGLRDARADAMVENLLAEVMPDGAWNCRRHRRPAPHHSSLHTTFNVLEGLRQWLERTPRHGLREAVLDAERRALDFVLEHRLFKSDKTGAVIDQRFTRLTYPHRWHYNVLRGLDYWARADAPRDERLLDAIELLHGRRRRDGRWPAQGRFHGQVWFDMESATGPSRWNTLRALRVLRWWESATQ
jgi:hypothetical protein